MAKFVVVTTNSGTGVLNTQIRGPSKVAIQCKEVEEGYEFSYVPMAPGDYLISIKYSNITIAGCPTKATVTGKYGGPHPTEIFHGDKYILIWPQKQVQNDLYTIQLSGMGGVKTECISFVSAFMDKHRQSRSFVFCK